MSGKGKHAEHAAAWPGNRPKPVSEVDRLLERDAGADWFAIRTEWEDPAQIGTGLRALSRKYKVSTASIFRHSLGQCGETRPWVPEAHERSQMTKEAMARKALSVPRAILLASRAAKEAAARRREQREAGLPVDPPKHTAATSWLPKEQYQAVRQQKEEVEAFNLVAGMLRDAAREDPVAFQVYCTGNEACEMHREWHRLIDQNDYCVIMASVESAKSQQVTIWRTVWELGRDPTLNFGIICNTAEQAAERGAQILEIIRDNDKVRHVFPDLDVGNKATDRMMSVAARPSGMPGYSVHCYGNFGPVRQARLNRIIADDVTTFMNSLTADQRDKVYEWFQADVIGRMLPGAKIVFLGNAVHREDALHRYIRDGTAFQVWPADKPPRGDVSAEYMARYAALPAGEPHFQPQWTRERLVDRRMRLGTLQSALQLDCEPRDDSTSRFKAEWISRTLARGKAVEGDTAMVYDLREARLLPGAAAKCGFDIAVSEHPKSDMAAINAVLIQPSLHRVLLWLEKKRGMQTPEMIRKVEDYQARYLDPDFIVESRGQQRLLTGALDGTRGGFTRAKIFPYGSAGTNDKPVHMVMEELAYSMERGLWTFPSDVTGTKAANKEVEDLCKSLLYWTPGEHVPDDAAALSFVEARTPRPKHGERSVVPEKRPSVACASAYTGTTDDTPDAQQREPAHDILTPFAR